MEISILGSQKGLHMFECLLNRQPPDLLSIQGLLITRPKGLFTRVQFHARFACQIAGAISCPHCGNYSGHEIASAICMQIKNEIDTCNRSLNNNYGLCGIGGLFMSPFVIACVPLFEPFVH
jgi:hypothetical protein